ncbi:MAG: hypothetical protein ACRENP_26390, partial [Longimicrobiales bacterium]
MHSKGQEAIIAVKDSAPPWRGLRNKLSFWNEIAPAPQTAVGFEAARRCDTHPDFEECVSADYSTWRSYTIFRDRARANLTQQVVPSPAKRRPKEIQRACVDVV